MELKKKDSIEGDYSWPECKYLYQIGIYADAAEGLTKLDCFRFCAEFIWGTPVQIPERRA